MKILRPRIGIILYALIYTISMFFIHSCRSEFVSGVILLYPKGLPFTFLLIQIWASLVAQWSRICLPMQETYVRPWVSRIPWRRKWQTTLVILPGKSHGQGKLVNYRLLARKRVRCSLATKRQKQFKSTSSELPHFLFI